MSKEAIDVLRKLQWNGNLRQLRSILVLALLLSEGSIEIRAEHIRSEEMNDLFEDLSDPRQFGTVSLAAKRNPERVRADVAQMLRSYGFLRLQDLRDILTYVASDLHKGNVLRAAEALNIDRKTFRYRLNNRKIYLQSIHNSWINSGMSARSALESPAILTVDPERLHNGLIWTFRRYGLLSEEELLQPVCVETLKINQSNVAVTSRHLGMDCTTLFRALSRWGISLEVVRAQ